MFTNHPDDWLTFLYGLIGEDEYQRLKRKAIEGVNQKFDWFEENDRLRAIWKQLDEEAA